MATAIAYNQWEDPGLSFTEEEVEAFNPQELGKLRLDYVLSLWAVAHRRADLPGTDKPVWWRSAEKMVFSVGRWYCMALELPGLDKEALTLALPSSQTAEGKKLAKAVVNAEPEEWLGEWIANAEACMRYAVTLGRRHASQHKNKNSKRLANKLANCITREMDACTRLTVLFESR